MRPATYIRRNRAFIPNYGERYRYGAAISTAFRQWYAEFQVEEVEPALAG